MTIAVGEVKVADAARKDDDEDIMAKLKRERQKSSIGCQETVFF